MSKRPNLNAVLESKREIIKRMERFTRSRWGVPLGLASNSTGGVSTPGTPSPPRSAIKGTQIRARIYLPIPGWTSTCDEYVNYLESAIKVLQKNNEGNTEEKKLFTVLSHISNLIANFIGDEEEDKRRIREKEDNEYTFCDTLYYTLINDMLECKQTDVTHCLILGVKLNMDNPIVTSMVSNIKELIAEKVYPNVSFGGGKSRRNKKQRRKTHRRRQ